MLPAFAGGMDEGAWSHCKLGSNGLNKAKFYSLKAKRPGLAQT